MLKVPIDKIMPVTDARANISRLVDEVVAGEVYVLTRGGRPAVVVAPVEYIEKLSKEGAQMDTAQKIQVTDTQNDVTAQNIETPENSNISNLPEKKEPVNIEPAVYEEKPTEPMVYQPQNNEPIMPAQSEPDHFPPAQPVNTVEEEQPIPVNVAKGVWQ